MRTSFKKLTSIFLAVLMVVSAFSVMGLAVSAAETGKADTGEIHEGLSGPEYKFLLTNNKGWSTVYVYAWNDEGDVTSEWPGWVMEDKSTNGYGEEVVAIYIPTSATGCCISDGNGNQTENITNFDTNYWVTDETVTGEFGQTMYKVQSWDDPGPDPDNPDPDNPSDDTDPFIPGTNTVYLDASAVPGDWYAWSYGGGMDGEFLYGSEENGVYRFDGVADNVIFVNTSDGGWTGRVGQTAGEYTMDGATYVLDGSAEPTTNEFGESFDQYGGAWGEGPIPTDPSETTPIETTTDAPTPTTTDAPTPTTTDAPTPTTTDAPTPTTTDAPTPTTTDVPDDGPFTAVVKLNGAEVKKQEIYGKDVTVTYNLTCPDLVVDGQATLTYDNTKLKIVSWEFPVVDMSVIDNLNATDNSALFNFTSPKKPYDFTQGAVLVTVKFEAIEGSKGNANINLQIEELDSADKVYAANSVITADGQAVVDTLKNVNLDTGSAPATQDTTAEPVPSDTDAPKPSETDAPKPSETDAPKPSETDAPTPTVTDAPTTAPATETQAPTPTPTKATQATQPTTVKKISSLKGTPAEASAVNFIKALKNDKDPKGSTFGKLRANAKKVTKKSVTVKWSKVSGAKKYVIMGNKCGSAYKKLKTVKTNKFVQKGLKKGTYYKYMILAVNSKGKVIAISKTLHAATKGGKVGNHKSVKFTNAKSSITLKKGKKFTLKAKAVKADKKVKNHRKIKFEASNNKVKVTASGKITAKKKGTAYVYAYAQNGVYKRLKVTVK